MIDKTISELETLTKNSSPKSLKQVIMDEYVKCATDASYFMRKYCIIQHPIKGKILFNLFDFQIDTLRQFQKNTHNVVLKSRQLGISTLVAGYSLWLMLFHSDKNILVIATKQGVAKNLVTKVRVMHQNLPSWLRGKCIEDNKLGLMFENGSLIKAESSSPEAGRSEALSLLVMDEAAFIPDINDIWASAALTLATGGDSIILSTPNGVGNLFHKMWKSTEDGELFGENFVFNPIKLMWWLHPDRNKSWRQQQEDMLGRRLAAQECDCDFVTSGNTVVEGNVIKWYEETYAKDPIEKQGVDHNFWIWKYPDYSKTYIVSADVSRGDGEDFSSAQVLDAKNLEQVAEYKGMLGTKEFGDLLVEISTKYNDALLVVDNSNMGWAVIQQIVDREYKNLFYSSSDMTKTDIHTQVSRGYDLRRPSQDSKLVPGITFSMKMRPIIVSKIDEYFRDKDIKVYSRRLISDLWTWIWQNGRADHIDGYNDDTIIALALGLLVRDTALKIHERGMLLHKKSLENINRVAPVYSSKIQRDDPYAMPIKDGHIEDLRWLIGAEKPKDEQNQ